ncbi:hypothetical protein ATERTT37_006857 [Aspergillus terreus]
MRGLPEPGLPTTFALPETPSLPVEDVSPGCPDVFSSLFDPVESSLSSSLTSLSTDFEDYLAAFPLPETANVDAVGPMQALPSEGQSEFSPGLHSGSAATQAPPGDTIPLFGRPTSVARPPANLETLFASDSYLLAILSLVIFKILDRYAMAAEIGAAPVDMHESLSSLPYPSPESIRLPASTGRADAGSESGCRVKTAQCVLRELHRVQRAVNQLSPRLDGYKTQHRPSATPVPLFSKSTSSAVLNPVMDQLEPELRKRLGALSLEIINMLRSDDS